MDEEEKGMRARDISLFVVCIAIAAPLIMLTDVYSSGPAGTDTSEITSIFVVSVVVGLLAAGGASILGFSFKTPAVLTAFLGIYVFCSALLVTMTGQMFAVANPASPEIAVIFSGVFTALFAVVGYFAALEIAGGPHGPME